MTESYLDMMEDSLQKKIRILQELERISLEQRDMFARGNILDEDAFDTSVERKGELIEQLEQLDEGFASLFENVKKEIGAHKDRYAAQIRSLQEQIRTVTALSSAIEAQEQRNKAAADKYFTETREELRKGKQTSTVAFSYYQTMNHTENIAPQHFDSKK